jgi:hypothetical protein
LVLSLFLVVICASVARAQTSLQGISNPDGSKIVYGPVEGATTPAAAMAVILRNVHNTCGEKPQVGKVFKMRGTNSDAVFFTAVNHQMGNRQRAGMIIVAPSGPHQMEMGAVIDDASRFGSTVNPMLTQLFGVWHPGGLQVAANAPAGPGSASGSVPTAAGGGGGALPPMRQVSLPDGTATVSLPAGWNIVPNKSAMGQTTVTGPQGEMLGLNYGYNAQDPYNPSYQNRMRRGLRFQGQVVYPINADLTKSFADVFQKIRAAMGQGPAPLEVDSVQAVPGSQGQCVNATGQLNPDGTAMREMNMLLCRGTPDQYGMYQLTRTTSLLPLGATDQQRATALAIVASYKTDMQRAQALANAQSAPVIARMQQTYQAHQQALMSFTQGQIANIHQIGANATARYNATQIANDQQHAAWRQGEDNISRNGQGFSNYILDQTVVQDNNMYGNGTIGHGTVWNSTADALVRANPNRWEIVNSPNYWQGMDY